MTEQRRSAGSHLEDCRLCPFLCGAERLTGDGICGVSDVSYIASEMLHMGEERMLRPAHAIFFSGCTARCHFCIAARYAFHPGYGISVTPEQLARRIVQRQSEGARSICFIGGDPVPHIPFILDTLGALGDRKAVPTVFNSNFFMTDAALDLLYDTIDIYLPDLKFGPGECGKRIGGMPDYWTVVTSAIERTVSTGEHVIVRHLPLPGHLHCCTEPVLDWLASLPDVPVSLLDQYVPPAHLRGPLAEESSSEERQAVLDMARRLRLNLVG